MINLGFFLRYFVNRVTPELHRRTCRGDDAVADEVILIGDDDDSGASPADPGGVLETLLDVGERLTVGDRVDQQKHIHLGDVTVFHVVHLAVVVRLTNAACQPLFCPEFQNGGVTKGFDARLADRPFLVSDFRALWRLGLSARVPESQKLKMVG